MSPASRGRDVLEVFPIDAIDAPRVGSGPPAPTPPTSGRRRIAPALIAAAVIVGGVAIATNDDDQPRAQPSATTSTPTTTVTTTPARLGVLLPAVADPPPGYEVAFAQQAFGTPGPAGISELWAGPGDSAISGGRWFLVEAMANSGSREWLNGDRRVLIGNEPGVVNAARPDDGQPPTVSFAPGNQWYVTITGTIGVDAMVDVLRGIDMLDADDDGRADAFSFTNDDFMRDLVLRSRIGGDDGGGNAVWGARADSVIAYSPGTSDGWVTITSGPPPSDARRSFNAFFLDHTVQLASGATASTGRMMQAGEVMSFEVAGVAITVAGNSDDGVLRAFADHAHIATPDEWRAAQRSAHYPVGPDGPQLAPIHIAEGALGEQAWSIVAYGPDTASSYQYSIHLGDLYGGGGAISGDAARSGIDVQAVSSGTFVIAHAPRTSGAGAVLRITIEGVAAPIELALADTDAALPWLTASVAFGDIASWTAEIVAADATVLASTTSKVA